LDTRNRYELVYYILILKLLVTSFPSVFKLIILCVKNCYVLVTFQRKIGCTDYYVIKYFFSLIKEISMKFHNTMPEKLKSVEEQDHKRLKKIFDDACYRCSHAKPKYDTLTSDNAMEVQGTIIKNEFQQLFDLEISDKQSKTLGRYGNVDLAIKDFLEYCGFGFDSSCISIASRLPNYFNGFITIKAELRHDEKEKRQLFLIFIKNPMDKIKFLRWSNSILYMSVSYFNRYWKQIYWQYIDFNRDKTIRNVSKTKYETHYNEIKELTENANKIREKSIFEIIANEIYLESVYLLFEIASKLDDNDEKDVFDFELKIQNNFNKLIGE